MTTKNMESMFNKFNMTTNSFKQTKNQPKFQPHLQGWFWKKQHETRNRKMTPLKFHSFVMSLNGDILQETNKHIPNG